VIGLLKQKTPANILILFVLGILIRLPAFKNVSLPKRDANDAFLYREIVNAAHALNGNVFFFAVITYILVFTQSLQLNKLINDQRMMQRNTYLPATGYLLVMALIPDWNIFSAPLIVNSFVLLVFNNLFRLHNQYHIKAAVFNVGLLTGIASFIFFPSAVLFVWLILGLMVMRPVRLTEWLICLAGFTSPYYFYAAYLLLTDNWSWYQLLPPLMINIPLPEQSIWLAASGFLLVFPFLIGGYYVQENLRRMLIQVRKNWSLFLIFLLFVLVIPFLSSKSAGLESWILIVIPFAAFHACAYLYPLQRWFSVIIFWITLLYILYYQYLGPGWN
jgi:hypothetical protein